MSDSLVVVRDGAVDRVTLNRADRLNALDIDLSNALRAYFRARQEDRDCRVIVLAGAGRGFCSGFDLTGGHLERVKSGVAGGIAVQREFREIVVAMRRCPQPIVAMLQGPVAGAGFSLALAADIRVAAEGAKLSAAFIKVGLSGCDMGSSYFLPRMIGASLATELLFTGKTLTAAQALAMGLVSSVVPEAELAVAAETYVEAMLETAPLGLALTKECFNANLDAPSLEAALALEDRNQMLLGQTVDFQDAAQAFQDKRKPVFQGR